MKDRLKYQLILIVMVLLSQSTIGQIRKEITISIDTVQVISFDTLQNLDVNETRDFLTQKTDLFNRDLDSLRSLSLTPTQYALKLDSAYLSFRLLTIEPLKERSDSLSVDEKKLLLKIDSITSAKSRVIDSVMNSGRIQDLSPDFLKDFSTSLPVHNPTVNGSAFDLPNGISMPDLENANLLGNASSIDIGKIENPIKDEKIDLKGQLSKTRSPELSSMSVGELTTEPERRVMNSKEANTLKSDSKLVESEKGKFESMKKLSDPDSASTIVKKEFKDYFAGKEEMLKKDMDEFFKLQLKYGSFNDMRFLPKHKPNEMKGKPFIERVVPGLMLQVFSQKDFFVDAAPTVGFRFSGHLTVGVGGYRRLTYVNRTEKLRGVAYYGVRLFGTYKALGTFHGYGEVDYFKNAAPSIFVVDKPSSEWKVKLNLGIQKRYNIGKGISGYTTVMYDALKIKRFPNTEGSSIRFGFDYQITKKKRSTVKKS